MIDVVLTNPELENRRAWNSILAGLFIGVGASMAAGVLGRMLLVLLRPEG